MELTFYTIRDKVSKKYVVHKVDCNLWLSRNPELDIDKQDVIDWLDGYKCDNDYKCHGFKLQDTEIVPLIIREG